MRVARLLRVCTLTLAVTLPAAARAAPDVRYVTGESANVRCQPGDGMEIYVTNVLRPGDPVEVVEEKGNYLKIRPPKGSFSWVNTRFLKEQPNHLHYVVVTAVPVPVFIGSVRLKGRPTIAGAQLERGHIVTSIGKPLVDGEGTWMPIEPPEMEYRYILTSDVSRTPPAQVAAAAGPQVRASGKVTDTPATPLTQPAPAVYPQAAPTDARGLYARARAAEEGRRYGEAIGYYEQLGVLLRKDSPAFSRQYLDHATQLRRIYYPSTVPPQRVPANEARYPATGGRSAAPPASKSDPLVAVSAPAQPTVRLAAPSGVGTTAARVPASWVPQPTGAPGTTSSATGVLYRAGRTVEGQTTYRLETTEGAPLLYVTPQTGIDLEPYLNRTVEVHGPAVYRGDLRANYMTVTSAQPLP